MKKILFAFSLFCTLLSGCSTDFDTIATYKEIMVIYGLLNPHEHIQYIKINKAFLGEGNALTMAQQSDSINYADVLDVRMDRILNGTTVSTQLLTRIDTVPKDAGIFSFPYQVLYIFTDSIYEDGSRYALTVTNRQTGVVATASTEVVGDVSVSAPSPGTVYKFSSAITKFNIQFTAAPLGVIYNVILRIHYKETNVITQQSVMKFVDWNLGTQNSNSDNTLSFSVYRPDFFRIIGANVLPDANAIRSLDSLDSSVSHPLEVIFIGGADDLNTYINLSSASQGITQETPVFSNVQNGLGLFTSRNMYSEWHDIDAASISALETNSYTSNLNFR